MDDDAKRWLNRAKEARTIADQMTDPLRKWIMLDIAVCLRIPAKADSDSD